MRLINGSHCRTPQALTRCRSDRPGKLGAVPDYTASGRIRFLRPSDWKLIGRDDTLIAKYGLTTAGFGHITEKGQQRWAAHRGLPSLEDPAHRDTPTLRGVLAPGQ